MGIGKTEDVGAPECKKHNYNALAICHRVTLVKALSNKLKLTYYRDEMLNEYEDDPESEDESKKNKNVIRKKRMRILHMPKKKSTRIFDFTECLSRTTEGKDCLPDKGE